MLLLSTLSEEDMSQYSQLNGILAARSHIDDQYDGKLLFRYKPLQGVIDGKNLIFQIPQTRIVNVTYNSVNIFPQIYKNDAALVFGTDYILQNPKNGVFQFTAAPVDGDSLDVTANYVWFDDVEWDHHLNRAANEIGFTTYYTQSSGLTNTEILPVNGTLPSDIPDGLFNAICLLAGSIAGRALALRFATRYDTSAGDHSFSPSQMAKAFTDLAEQLEKRAYNARDDFYKGQGRQYRPATSQQGFILPNWTPPR